MMETFWHPYQVMIKECCESFNQEWQTRKRVIDTYFLVLFILKLILTKNQQGYKSLLHELWESEELEVYQRKPISSSSLCEARQKLPEEIFIQLNKKLLLLREEKQSLSTWHGHRVFAVDGSKLNVPRELIHSGYQSPNQASYYPQALLSGIYHLESGLIYEGKLFAEKDERGAILEQMRRLLPNDVLVLDRGYFSYLLLHQACEMQLHLVCRLQLGSMNKAIKQFYDSDLIETVIDYYPSPAVKSEIKKKGYQLVYRKIPLRLIKYTIDDTTYLCATTLLEETYLADEFAQIYHGRWGVEEFYKISKEFINIEEFHSKTERGVRQELYAHLFLINLARLFESEADDQFPPSTKEADLDENTSELKHSYWQDFCGKLKKYKINFKNCLLVVSRHLTALLMSTWEENYPLKILRSISQLRQKIRPGRHYPRQSRKPYSKWKSSNASKTITQGA